MRSFVLALCLALPLAAQVTITPKSNEIAVEINGKPFTTLYYASSVPKPYFHPLMSASGKQVTRGWPMTEHGIEEKDHPHHRGLWFTHGDVNGASFWENEYKPGKRGFVKFDKLIAAKGGKKSGTIEIAYDWVDEDRSKKTLLKEVTKVTFYAEPKDVRILDYVITITPVEDVTFGDTKEGSFALRLTPSMNEKHGGKMTNAEGLSGEKAVWGKPSAWVDYAGQVDGETLGITIMDHPSNPKYPTKWHSRGYGLFAANRYGDHDFTGDKSQNGSQTYPAGKPVTFRYRVVIHSGDTASSPVARWFEDFRKTK